jgi:hypothetical protein
LTLSTGQNPEIWKKIGNSHHKSEKTFEMLVLNLGKTLEILILDLGKPLKFSSKIGKNLKILIINLGNPLTALKKL